MLGGAWQSYAPEPRRMRSGWRRPAAALPVGGWKSRDGVPVPTTEGGCGRLAWSASLRALRCDPPPQLGRERDAKHGGVAPRARVAAAGRL